MRFKPVQRWGSSPSWRCSPRSLGRSASAAPAGSSAWRVGWLTNAVLARGLVRSGSARLGPADQVTLARATLAGGVAALTADAFSEVAR